MNSAIPDRNYQMSMYPFTYITYDNRMYIAPHTCIIPKRIVRFFGIIIFACT